MKFALLTNQVRAARRSPLLVPPVNADMLARLFPGVKKLTSSAPAPKNSRPVGPLSHGQPTCTKVSPVQIPMEVFGSPDRSSPIVHFPQNGKHQPGSLNGSAVRPFDRSIPGPAPKNGVARPGEPRKENSEKQTNPSESARQAEPSPPQHKEPDTSGMLRATRSALGLHRLIEQHPDLPDQSILLGVCEDGLPLVLDLFDPGTGALLTIGDDRESQLELLHNVIDSAASRNSPRGLQFLVISHHPQSWQAWIKERGFSRHSLDVVSADDESVRTWVLRLADWTEQRRLGQISGPPVLLVMDTLSFLSRLAYDVRLNFDWMAKEGPLAQIWPLAAISTDLAASQGIRILRSFQSRILGYSKNPQVYANLVGLSKEEAGCFSKPGQYGVLVGERWIHFRLPA